MAALRLRADLVGRAPIAYAGLLLFCGLVYSNPGNLLFANEAEGAGIAKGAAALGLGALGFSTLLYDRPLRIGGAVGGCLLAFFAWVGLSASWSLWPALTLETLLDGVKYLAIFFLVANVVDTEARAATLVHALAWCSVIPAVGEISSWSRGEHLVEGDRAAWIGIFANPNDLAYHLVVGVALALGARELTARRWLRIAYLGGVGIMGTGILLTQSRGGLIAAAAVLGLWGVRGLQRGRTLIAVLAIAALAIHFAPRATVQRAETIRAYQDDASAQGRIDAWRTGWNVMKALPLTGVGAGAFALAWPEYAPGDAGAPRSAHNTFVQVVAETGLPSLLAFGGALLAAALGLSRPAKPLGRVVALAGDAAAKVWRRQTVLARSVQVGLGGFAVCSLTGGHAYSWPLYLLLGLAAALIRLFDEQHGHEEHLDARYAEAA